MKARANMEYIDLTQKFFGKMPVYPGDSTPILEEKISGGIVDHKLITGMHVGTHMDAPLHMLAGGKYLSEYPVEKFFGRGVLIDLRGKTGEDIEKLPALRSLGEGGGNLEIRPGDIVLINFGWSKKFNQADYFADYPVLTEALAKKLIELKVSMVGMDTPSPDRGPYTVHKLFLNKDILIIENLANLESLAGKSFEVVALPIKLQADAAFCRVVAKIL